MLRSSTIIHERSTMIRIPRSPSSREEEEEKEKEREKEEVEYSLKENIFDPFKCSPTNDFMLKLELRMSRYFKK